MNNKKAQDFKLLDQYGIEFNLYKKLDEHGMVLLVFYPRDNSPVCTKQLCSYNKNLERFGDLGVYMAAVNNDSVSSHREFSDKYSFSFPVLSDEKGKVSRIYDALNLIRINRRKVVLINRNREIVFEDSVFPAMYRSPDKLVKVIKEYVTN